jgi:four helix bundle protein
MGDGFRELQVWQRAKDLAVHFYKVTNSTLFSRDYGLRDQIRWAAVSVASNVAEDDERDTNKDSVRFLYMAKGSIAEIITQTIIAKDIGYLDDNEFGHILNECETIGKMLGKLIKVRINNP